MVKIKIPPQTQTGKKFRLKGRGLKARKEGEEDGEHYVTVEIKMFKALTEHEIELYHQLKAVEGNIREGILGF